MIHEGYNDIIEAFSYSIGNFVNLFMGGLYNLFKIILLQTDSNGNVIGLNFLGTCIFCILGLIFTLWIISYLIQNMSFGQTKEDLPTFTDTEHSSYWGNVIKDSVKKQNQIGSRMANKLMYDNMKMAENKVEMKLLRTKYNYYNRRITYANKQWQKYNSRINKSRKRK